MVVEFAPRFTGSEPANAEYRQRNRLRLVAETEPAGAVTDAAVCHELASKIDSTLRADVWQYWGTVSRTTHFMRFGPYYFVYVRGLLPGGSVGSGGYTYFVFDAVTLEELPLVFDFP